MSPLLGYVANSGDMKGVVGVALNGVPFFSGTSEKGFDAYYPKTYAGSSAVRIYPDICLGDSTYSTFYHYYTMSPCIFPGTAKSLTSGT